MSLSWICQVADESPIEAFDGLGKEQGPCFMVEGRDFGTSSCIEDGSFSVDIELLRATQRLDRLCLRCSKTAESNILSEIDLLDEEISQMCDEFEEISNKACDCMDQTKVLLKITFS